MGEAGAIDKPHRWDEAFDPEMPESDFELICGKSPFSRMDPDGFPKHLPLEGIIRNDTRLRRFAYGEIVVREGDYGTSALMIMKGRVRVVVSPGLPAEALGRRRSKRKSLFRIIAQLWANSKIPERLPWRTKSEMGVSTALGRDKTVRIVLQDVPRVLDRHRTAVLEDGEFFGEIAALSRMPRVASVFAEEEGVILLEIRWQGLRDLMRYDAALKNHIDQIYRERALESYLLEIPLFQHLDEEQLKRVMREAVFETFGDYDWSGSFQRLAEEEKARLTGSEPVIALEGDYPNGVVLIRAGFARLSQKFGNGLKTLNYLGAGHHYGVAEIAHNFLQPDQHQPLRYSLRVVGYTHVIIVPTRVMEQVVLPTLAGAEVKALAATLQTAGEAGDDSEPQALDVDASAKIGTDLLEFFAEHRFFNGTATMVINLDQCTRCDDCVQACARAHDNNPRFLRHGPTQGNVMVANACMHCADPVCMIGCPTGAIHRDSFEGQVVINPDTCIGCQACFNNCPYDAIRMVEVRNEKGEIMVDHEMNPINKATKCDLCVDQLGGPACQRACPHDALTRANLDELDVFSKWLKR